ncbi:helix-turn-helix domain-containing protein [Marinilabiliaceae bacterium JC017]|nr:helix-turn-helix domain-containing protein [Marinilabiliaceae bacterium JC017]
MKERIQKILQRESLTPSKFADVIGVQRSGVSHILSGRNNPSLDFLNKILDHFPYISGDWLITGKGEMIKPDVKSAPKPQLLFNSPKKVFEPEKERPIPSATIKIEKEPENIPEKKIKESESIENISPFLSDKKIERVVVFYTDKTFREYCPENND